METSTVDAYGNLIVLTEPNPAGGTLTTNYTYTPVNQLTGVSMTRGNVTQTRTFLYNGSDMTSATNPENGAVTYVYDNSHHVTSRTDALGSKTVYTYDSYGRLSEVQYYPGFGYYNGIEDPNQRVTYYYDGNYPQAYPCKGLRVPSSQYSTGRLSAVVFAGGIADAYKDSYCYQYAYTKPGRVATQQMMVASPNPNTSSNTVNFTASFQWDDEGRMTSLQYPAVSFGGMPVNMPIAGMQYDVNGRLNAMTMDNQNGQGPQPFASASYYPTGQLYTLRVQGYAETRTYNSLMQLTSQSVPGTMNMTYNYSATQNNGRIASSVDGITGENTSYSYDALNRLTNASNSLWSEAYTYDGFGNLTSKTGSGGSPNPAPTVSLTYNSKNQPANFYYDANGNQNACNSPQCGNSYSVENRMTLEVLGSYPYPANIYAYDPWGKRVMSGYNPSYGSPLPNYNYTFYGITGQKLAMVTCNGSNYPAYPTCAIVGQNVYFGKKLIVAGGATVLTDRLGSVRANGQGETPAYYPYGEERTSTVDGREKFGTYFRDAIGQDYADQRYYGSGTGSFFTAGPGAGSGNASGSLTWNRYSYANGDPVNHWDPSGLDGVCGPFGYWMGEGCYGNGGGSPSSGPAYGCNDDWATFGEGCTMGDDQGVGCYGNGNGLLGTPDPGCPNGGGGGDSGPSTPPLQCDFGGVVTAFPPETFSPPNYFGFFLPISFLFSATGGTGVYSWSNGQMIGTSGFEQYTGGTVNIVSGASQETLPNKADNPQGPNAVIFDAPGLISPTGYGSIVNAMVVWTATLSVSVSSGGLTVNCPTVQWQAFELWLNGKPAVYDRGVMNQVGQ